MDVYLYDRRFLEEAILDTYDSLIWTERFSDAGDFVLTLPDTSANRLLLYPGRFLGIKESLDHMIVETLEDQDGILTVRGPSLISIFKSRMFRDTYTSNVKSSNITGTPGKILQTIVECLVPYGPLGQGSVGPAPVGDVITQLYFKNPLYYDANVTIATANSDILTVAVPYGELFAALKSQADAFGLGFSLRMTNANAVQYSLAFSSYDGRNLTTGNPDGHPVVRFDPALDSLDHPHELRSLTNYKNVAYCWAPSVTDTSGYYVGVAYTDGASALSGFDRRVIMVSADDINNVDLSTPAKQAAFRSLLNQRAANALAQNNYVRGVDGTIVPQSAFVYNRDYQMGDYIELKSASGIISVARVTEYIRSKDAQGSAAYPTLSVVSE